MKKLKKQRKDHSCLPTWFVLETRCEGQAHGVFCKMHCRRWLSKSLSCVHCHPARKVHLINWNSTSRSWNSWVSYLQALISMRLNCLKTLISIARPTARSRVNSWSQHLNFWGAIVAVGVILWVPWCISPIDYWHYFIDYWQLIDWFVQVQAQTVPLLLSVLAVRVLQLTLDALRLLIFDFLDLIWFDYFWILMVTGQRLYFQPAKLAVVSSHSIQKQIMYHESNQASSASATCGSWKLVCWARLVGYSDWQGKDLIVYVDDSALENGMQQEKLRHAVVDHVTILYRHIFLASKPSRPAQARWTGVASVAEFALGLSLSFGMLQPLFASLASKDSDSSGLAKTMDKDADVWAPFESALSRKQWFIIISY